MNFPRLHNGEGNVHSIFACRPDQNFNFGKVFVVVCMSQSIRFRDSRLEIYANDLWLEGSLTLQASNQEMIALLFDYGVGLLVARHLRWMVCAQSFYPFRRTACIEALFMRSWSAVFGCHVEMIDQA